MLVPWRFIVAFVVLTAIALAFTGLWNRAHAEYWQQREPMRYHHERQGVDRYYVPLRPEPRRYHVHRRQHTRCRIVDWDAWNNRPTYVCWR